MNGQQQQPTPPGT